MIRDSDLVLTESAAIVEYVCRRHAGGRLTDRPNYPDYLYWMHFSNNVLGMFFARRALQRAGLSPEADAFVRRRERLYFGYLKRRLGQHALLAGPEFTCAGVIVKFNLTALPQFGGRRIDDLPSTRAYVGRITARPAYAEAMRIAGPGASRPTPAG